MQAMNKAWIASVNGKKASEGGGREGSLNLTGTPSNYKIVTDNFSNEVGFHSIKIIRQFANFHTHDDESGPKPSTPNNNSQGNRLGDTGVANKYHFDIYVMSSRGLYRYDWKSKQTSAKPLRKGRDWLKPC